MLSVCMLNNTLLSLDEARIAPNDRGWTLADGCFETLRVTGGSALWLDDHLARLAAGLAVLHIPTPDWAELPEAIMRLLAAHHADAGIVRLQVSRGPGTQRGLVPPASSTPTILLTFAPAVPLPAKPVEQRAVLATCTRRNEWSPLSRIKALANYPDLLLALHEAHERGADEALMLNTAGAVVCSSVANLWVFSAGRLRTPPVEAGITPGVVRRHLLGAAVQWGLAVDETPLQPADLWRAEEVLLTNVVRGVQAVVALDGLPIGNGKAGSLAGQILEWLKGVTS